MTTFQDPPLHSRRAVRQNEVRDGEHTDVDAPVTSARGRTGRRAQLPSATEWPDGGDAVTPTASEPFTFTTQSASPVIVATPPARRADAEATIPETVSPPRPGSGRRASLPAGELATEVVPPEAAVSNAADSIEPAEAVVRSADAVEIVDAPVATPAPVAALIAPEVAAKSATVPAPVVAGSEVVQHTMTRRELRELRLAAERAAELQVPEAIGAILNSGPIILPYLSAGPSAPVAASGASVPVTSDTNPTVVSASGMIDGPPQPASAGQDGPTGDAIPVFIEPMSAPVSTRSAGHWSVRADMDDDIESLENTITRSVGVSGSITTSALVLPSIPQSSDITSPFTASGEIMSTGSIDLPRSLSSTGVHPSRVDTSDFDHDPMDREIPSTDSAPVRAIRAVSTHTGSNGMIVTKKQSNRTLTVLVISASTMAVGVVGLLVAGVVLNVFP
ncbi:MAG: hypothetical protein JWQ43_1297 [Glaciihabitans sp.]|nr:hypothetical protein [Glaciihabitans sp.]